MISSFFEASKWKLCQWRDRNPFIKKIFKFVPKVNKSTGLERHEAE